MNPIQQALQMLKGFGKGVDQTGANVYNGIRGATMNFDKTLGIPDSRLPLNILNPVTAPDALAQQAQASPSVTPMQQAIQQMAPVQAPSAPPAPTSGVPFGDFTTAKVPQNLSPLIYNSAAQAGVDPNVFASLLFTEHGFQTSAGINKNTDGSYDRGIAQINNKAHPEISDQQALDPNFAIPWAAKALAAHVKNLGGYTKGIAAYNVGEGGASNPSVFNGAGMRYVGKVAAGLSPTLQKQLGIRAKAN